MDIRYRMGSNFQLIKVIIYPDGRLTNMRFNLKPMLDELVEFWNMTLNELQPIVMSCLLTPEHSGLTSEQSKSLACDFDEAEDELVFSKIVEGEPFYRQYPLKDLRFHKVTIDMFEMM